MLEAVRRRSLAAVPCLTLFLTAGCQGTGTLPDYLGSEAEYFTPSARIYFDKGKDEIDEIDLYRDGSIGPAVDFLAINWPILVRQSTLSASKAKEVEVQREELKKRTDARKEAEGNAEELELKVEEARTKERRAELEPSAAAEKEAASAARRREEDGLDVARKATDRTRQQETEQATKVAAMEQDVSRANKTRLDGDWIIGPRISIGITGPATDSEDGSKAASGAPVLYIGIGAYMDFFKGDRKPNSDDGVGVRLETGLIRGITADEEIGDTDDSAVYVGMTVFL